MARYGFMGRMQLKRSGAALAATIALAAPAASAQDIVLACRSAAERMSATLEVTADEARLDIEAVDGRRYTCRAKPEFLDGRVAQWPYYKVNLKFRAEGCTPAMPREIAREIRRDISFHEETIRLRKTLVWTIDNTIDDCPTTIDRLEAYFEARKTN